MIAKTYLTATELIMDTDGKMMIFAHWQKGGKNDKRRSDYKNQRSH